MSTESTIALIGGGNMGESLLSGLLASGHPASRIRLSDPTQDRLNYLHDTYHITTTPHNLEAMKDADVIVLAVKPQNIAIVSEECAKHLQTSPKVVLSIAAGIPLISLNRWLGETCPIIRAMPNTPALIQAGITALFPNHAVNHEQKSLAEYVMRAVGTTVWLHKESDMDIVTAISGSGPAYFFYIMNIMQEIAVSLGLDADLAKLLVLQTACGSTRLALESDESLKHLEARVTSKGGTTEAALSVFNKANIASIFEQAIKAAADRSLELSKLLGDLPHDL